MKFGLKCIGRFKNVEVKLDGITVICGENSTGKSTVGKALFCCFNSMCDFDKKILEMRKNEFCAVIDKYNVFEISPTNMIAKEISQYYYTNAKNNSYDYEAINNILSPYFLDDEDDLVDALIRIMERSDEDIFNAYIFRYFNETFIGQIRNINSPSNAISRAALEFSKGTKSVRFYSNKCILENKDNNKMTVRHPAYYIDNPFVVADLNYHSSYNREIDGNVINAIVQARKELAVDKTANIFDEVENKERLQEVYAVMKKAYKGKTVIKDGQYFYEEKGSKPVNFINLSTGLKSFALIERLLESGKLKKKDVLILDEPEIHLHPEWQLVYAEVIVLLQKALDLTVLITTHSIYFLDAIDKYSKKYDTAKNTAYYLAQNEGVHSTLEDVSDSLEKIYEQMFNPTQKLENMEYGIYD